MDKINIEVCYPLPTMQYLISLALPRGATVINAIMASGILDQFEDLTLNDNVGIFSRKVPLNHLLKDGDRIEIYRPLILTPNQSRLLRAKRKQS